MHGPLNVRLLIYVEPLRLKVKYIRGCKNEINLKLYILFEEIRYLRIFGLKKVLLLITLKITEITLS